MSKKIMNFIIEHQNQSINARLARLIFGTQSQTEFQTPMCLLYTKNGCVPHLTHDVLQKVTREKLPTLFPLPSIIDFRNSLAEYKEGVGHFCGLSEYPIYMSCQDPSTESVTGFNNKTGISVFGHGGRIQIGVEEYAKILSTYKPDWFQSLSDAETPKDCSKKRVKHSVTRSLEYLDQLLELKSKNTEIASSSVIFGSIQGGYDLKARQFSTTETALRPVDGFVIEGFHLNGPETEKIKFEEVKEIILSTVNGLPKDKPKILHGGFNPTFILKAVESGIDVFDATYPFLVSERGSALIFDYSNLQDQEKRINDEYEINLSDPKYKDEMQPILTDCQCYTCLNFTKAYVNHLLVTSEMLASVLLMIHNLYHFLGFFTAIRESIKGDRLEQLIAKFK